MTQTTTRHSFEDMDLITVTAFGKVVEVYWPKAELSNRSAQLEGMPFGDQSPDRLPKE